MAYKPYIKKSNNQLEELPLYADKAEKDADGNTISSTYLKKSDATTQFNNKADKTNSNQVITAKTVTANTGNFENISSSLTTINTGLTERGTLTLLYSGNPAVNTTFTLSQSITNFKYLFVVFLGSGGYVVTGFIPVAYWKDTSLNTNDWVINGTINNQVRYYQIKYVSNTSMKIGERSNCESLKIYGIK